MYARDDTPLPPILTDGSWTVPFELFGADTSHPLDQTGNTFDLTFAPKGRSQPAASDVHVLSSPGAITVVSNVVTVSNAVWTGWSPGVYQVELRQTNGANPDPIYVGTVTVAQGLSEVAALGGGSVIPAPPGAAAQLFYGTTSVQIVRGEASESALQAQASAEAAAASEALAAAYATKDTDFASGTDNSAKSWAVGGTGNGEPSLGDAKSWATLTGAEVAATDYSAKEWSIGSTVPAGSSKEWATVTGVEVGGVDYSAKEYAIGTFVPSGSAKLWATLTGAAVAGGLFSAQEWATGTFTRGAAGGGSAKDWATYTGGPVDGTNYSALYWANSASGSATTATQQATAAANAQAAAQGYASQAATSAGQAASNTTATLIDILEKVSTYDTAATLAQVAATSARGVTNSAAASSGGQYFRVGLLTSTSLTGVATFTRAASSWGFDQSGTLNSYASGVPVVNTKGVASYEGRTNYIRNPTATGAVSGVVGSGGALPTNWTRQDGLTGLTTTVTAGQTMNGVPGIFLRVQGTPSGTQLRLVAELTNQPAAANGQTWTGAWFSALVAGSLTNVTNALINTAFFDGSNNSYNVVQTTFTPAAALARNAATSTGANAAITLARCEYRVTMVSGQAVDFTLFLGAPQLCQGTDINDPPILQAGTTSTGTRNPDVISETVNVPVGQAFSVVGKCIAPPTAAMSQGPTVFMLAAPNGNDRVYLQFVGTVSVTAGHRSASLSGPGLQFNTVTGGQPVGFVLAVNGDTLTLSINGAAAITTTMAGGAFVQALTNLYLGCDSSGGSQLNSQIRELRILDRALSAAECATFSDVSLEWDLDFTTQTYKYLGAVYSSLTDLPMVTFSRASTAYEVTVAGFVLNVASGVVRACDAGLTIEPGTTNAALWCRDLTNAVWVGSNMTAAKDQTGADGVAAAASSITATAANATILQSITLASGSRCQSAYVKRITGSGTVYMTTDGGMTWSAIAVGAAWAQVAIPAQTLANPTIGFMLATSGDKIAVDFVQNEAGSYATSPMATTSATFTRNPDVLASNDPAPTIFSALVKVTIPSSGPTSAVIWQGDDGTANNVVAVSYNRSTGHLALNVTTGGVSQAALDLGAAAAGTTHAIAFAVNTNDVAATVDGGAMVTKSTGVTTPTTTTMRWGMANTAGSEWGAGIMKFKRWRGRVSNANLQTYAAAA